MPFSPHDLVVLINVSKLREMWPSLLLDGSTKTDNSYYSLSDILQPLVVLQSCLQLKMLQGAP